MAKQQSRYILPLNAGFFSLFPRQALLEHNAVVYIAARNREKVEAAINELKAETGKEALFMKVDLGDLSSIKIGVEDFIK